MPENRQMSDADTQPLLPELALPRDAQSGVWPAQRLKAALARGEIQTIEPLDSQQVQPASIDLRLGPVAYEIAASFLPGPQLTVQDKLPLVTQRKISLENGAVLKTGHVYLVPLMETLQLRKRSSGVANPKSSTGRLDVFCRVITDYGVEFDQIPERYTGPLWLEIAPRSFHVKVRQGSRLSQLRLKTGTPPSSNAFIRRLDEEVRIVRDEDGPANVKDGAIALSVDISASGGSDLIGYKARKVSEEIDIDKIGHYDVDTFWERVYRPKEGGLILHPDEFHILATKEKVAVPDYLAADMVAYNTMVGEFRVHYAGFFDPGFGYTDGIAEGSKIVLEVRAHEVPFMVEHGQIVGRVTVERLTHPTDAPYGGAIGSNYHRQSLTLGKQFKR